MSEVIALAPPAPPGRPLSKRRSRTSFAPSPRHTSLSSARAAYGGGAITQPFAKNDGIFRGLSGLVIREEAFHAFRPFRFSCHGVRAAGGVRWVRWVDNHCAVANVANTVTNIPNTPKPVQRSVDIGRDSRWRTVAWNPGVHARRAQCRDRIHRNLDEHRHGVAHV